MRCETAISEEDMMDDIYALTLWPEWAWAITALGKDVENRVWPAPEWILGKRIYIHAGAKFGGKHTKIDSAIDAVSSMAMRDHIQIGKLDVGNGAEAIAVKRSGKPMTFTPESDIPRSALVATAVVEGCSYIIPGDEILSTGDPISPWAAWGQYSWRLSDICVLPWPIPMRGYQKLWKVSLYLLRSMWNRELSQIPFHEWSGVS